jgi:hypothetical protein
MIKRIVKGCQVEHKMGEADSEDAGKLEKRWISPRDLPSQRQDHEKYSLPLSAAFNSS